MYAAILANLARHVALTPPEADLFTALLVPGHAGRLDHLLRAGQPVRCLTFVVQGCVRTYAVDEQGKEHNLAFATEGWWCADFASLFARSPATLALQALEATSFFQLSLDHLEQLCERVPKFERFFRHLFQNGFVFTQRRLADALRLPADARYLRFCRQYPRLHQRVAQKHIASYLGITPEFLSMLRRRFATAARS